MEAFNVNLCVIRKEGTSVCVVGRWVGRRGEETEEFDVVESRGCINRQLVSEATRRMWMVSVRREEDPQVDTVVKS